MLCVFVCLCVFLVLVEVVVMVMEMIDNFLLNVVEEEIVFVECGFELE